jgi:hypothetical protein
MKKAGKASGPQDLTGQRSAATAEDPQPDIDGEMLLRMYQALSSDA